MTKTIRVSDEIYEELKKEAGMQFRSMSSQIEYLLAMEEKNVIERYEREALDWSERNLPDVMKTPIKKVGVMLPAPTPEKNKSVGKPNFCKLHQMDKEYCGLMKH